MTWQDYNEPDYEAAVASLAEIHESWATQAESCRPSRPCYGCRLKAHRAIEAALGLPMSSAQEHHTAARSTGEGVEARAQESCGRGPMTECIPKEEK